MATPDVSSSGADRKFVKRAMSAPLLDRDRELSLATRWREDQDEEALHELCTAYMRLVVAIATRFRTYGLPMSDLVQEGNVGLMLAAARFEPERELRFSTYATWWIRSCIQDFILRNWSIVRTGTTAAPKIYQTKRPNPGSKPHAPTIPIQRIAIPTTTSASCRRPRVSLSCTTPGSTLRTTSCSAALRSSMPRTII
jgi:DNA-directed RNA polymerase sigma subunit (sigma70/sigma32)